MFCGIECVRDAIFFKPVRAVSILKKSGEERLLGIPAVGDRIAQTVVQMLVGYNLEKVFDADSYGFRPGRSAHQALTVTRKRYWFVECDIRKLFNCIDHELLMKALRHHVSERWVLLYVERWLKAPQQHTDGLVEQRSAKTPQADPLSPLLVNLFMHYGFDAWMALAFRMRLFADTPMTV